MATRKKKPAKEPTKPKTDHIPDAPAAVTPEVLGKGPVWIDGQLYMSPFDLTRYNLAEARLANAGAMRALKRLEFERETQKHNKVMDQLLADEVRQRDTMLMLRKEIAELYPVSFDSSNLTFDNETGRLMLDGAPILKPE